MVILPNSSEYDLLKVITTTTNVNMIIRAIEHKNATKELLPFAIERIEIITLGNHINHAKGMSAVIKSSKVTPRILIEIIEKTESLYIIKDIVSSVVATEKVLDKAIDRIKSMAYSKYTSHTEILSEVIHASKVTPKVLVKIIKSTTLDWLIIEAINSDVATDEVYDAALEHAKSFTTGAERLKIEEAVAKKRGQNLSVINPVKKDVQEAKKDSNDEVAVKETIKVVEEEKIVFNVENEDNVTERLRRNVEDGMSTMLWGLSGIGKTARVKEVDPDYTMIKLKNDMLPEEVTGGKEPNGEPGAIYPPFWYVRLCEKCEKEPDKMHILFIDELTNVKNNVKSLVWDIIEDRRVNGNEDWELPENCAVVAAGNRPEESTAVITDYNGGVLPEPLHDRFDFHIEIPLDMAEWQQWALETNPKTGNLNIHPSVLSFCVAHAKEVMFTSINVDDVTQPRLSPRRWEKLSKAIYMAEKRGGKACHVSNQRITECIGKDIAPAFIAHYEKQPLSMKKVEAGLYKPDDFKNIDDKLFALSSLIAEYKGSHMAVIDFIETCLGDDYVAVYNVMKNQQNELISSGNTEEVLSSDTVKK